MPEINDQRERKNLDKATSYTGIWERGEVAKARGFTLISDEEIQKAEKQGMDAATKTNPLSEIYKAIAQAQLDSCEEQHLERLRAIKRELEMNSFRISGNPKMGDWERTVIKLEGTNKSLQIHMTKMLEQQAKASFEAGKAEGIKTVVELLNREMNLSHNGLNTRHWHYNLDYEVWQSFLKRHGMEG